MALLRLSPKTDIAVPNPDACQRTTKGRARDNMRERCMVIDASCGRACAKLDLD
jgi:hypothetical protein